LASPASCRAGGARPACAAPRAWTVAALGDAAAGHLRDYLRAVPSFTVFFVPEGLAFIDYVAALPVPELVHSVGRFERAMWLARFEPQRPPTVIEFAAPPDLVLGAALQPLRVGRGRPGHGGGLCARTRAPIDSVDRAGLASDAN